jgi:hypothetical protein
VGTALRAFAHPTLAARIKCRFFMTKAYRVLPARLKWRKASGISGLSAKNAEPKYFLSKIHVKTSGQPALGAGQFSVPCRSCGTDELIYQTVDLIPVQADKDEASSPALPRRTPSNRPRQPAARRYPKAKPTFGPRFLEDRPECAVIVARCVSGWSYVENAMALLLAAVLKINTEPALAMFLAISNSRTQVDVLAAAAEAVLSERDFELFRAMINVRKSIEKDRNHLVHGVFGGSMLVKDGILWAEQKHQTGHTATVWASDYKEMKTDFLRDVYVYEPEDLETIAQSIEWLHTFIGLFRGYISSDNSAWRVERYPQLCAEPRISQELSQLRADRKKNS